MMPPIALVVPYFILFGRVGLLDKLPVSTTKVIIAHRLNTIANADEILFINAGEITPAGSMEHALDMLMHGKRVS